MIEVPRFCLGTLGLIVPQPINHRSLEIPFHFQKRTLRQIYDEEGKIPESLWTGRANFVEDRVKRIIESQYVIVESVTMNEPYAKGSDLTVTLVKGSSVKVVKIEVKSSTLGIIAYKRAVKDKLPEGQRNMDAVKNWMAENGIILINGGKSDGKEKTPEEILSDSFYPQLERILTMVSKDRSTEPPEQMILFPEHDQIQIWPRVASGTFTQLFL